MRTLLRLLPALLLLLWSVPLCNAQAGKSTKDEKEPKKEEPKKDGAKKDEPKKDETKKDDAKKDDPKKDEPKKDGESSETDVGPYLEALKDESPQVRKRVIMVLEKLKSKAAIPALLEMLLRDEDKDCRERALVALRKFNDEEKLDAILAALKDSKQERGRRIIACKALVKLYGKDPKTYEALEGVLADKDPEVRTEAALGLEEIDQEQSRTIIVTLDSAKLKTNNLTAEEVFRRLDQPPLWTAKQKQSNVFECTINPAGARKNFKGIKGILIAVRGKQILKLGDVATVEFIPPVKEEKPEDKKDDADKKDKDKDKDKGTNKNKDKEPGKDKDKDKGTDKSKDSK